MKIAIYKRIVRLAILELQNNEKFLIYSLTNKECVRQLFDFFIKIYHYPSFSKYDNFWQNYS